MLEQPCWPPVSSTPRWRATSAGRRGVIHRRPVAGRGQLTDCAGGSGPYLDPMSAERVRRRLRLVLGSQRLRGGAEGQNRTGDTMIFRPNVCSPSPSRLVHPVGFPKESGTFASRTVHRLRGCPRVRVSERVSRLRRASGRSGSAAGGRRWPSRGDLPPDATVGDWSPGDSPRLNAALGGKSRSSARSASFSTVCSTCWRSPHPRTAPASSVATRSLSLAHDPQRASVLRCRFASSAIGEILVGHRRSAPIIASQPLYAGATVGGTGRDQGVALGCPTAPTDRRPHGLSTCGPSGPAPGAGMLTARSSDRPVALDSSGNALR